MMYILLEEKYLKFDPKNREIVSHDGKTVILSERERVLFTYFLESNKKFFLRHELQDYLGEDEQSINSIIFKLRKKISTICTEKIIITARGQGYRINTNLKISNSRIETVVKNEPYFKSILVLAALIISMSNYLMGNLDYYFYLINKQKNLDLYSGIYEVYCNVDGTMKIKKFTKPDLVSSFIKYSCSKEHYLEVNFKSPAKELS